MRWCDVISLLRQDALLKIWRQTRPHLQVSSAALNCSAAELYSRNSLLEELFYFKDAKAPFLKTPHFKFSAPALMDREALELDRPYGLGSYLCPWPISDKPLRISNLLLSTHFLWLLWIFKGKAEEKTFPKL